MASDWKSLVLLSTLLVVFGGTICGACAETTQNEYEASRLRYEAHVYLDTKDYAKAEQLYRRANALDDKDMNGLINLAWVCTQQGKPRDAVAPLQRACEVEPNNSDVKVRLVEAYSAIRDDRSALNVLDALQRMPLSAVDKEFTLSHLGAIQSRNRRPNEAAKAYRELALLKPNDSGYLYNLINAYQMGGHYAEASNLAKVFLTKFPSDKNARYLNTLTSKLKRETEQTGWFGRWSERAMPLKVCLLDPTKPVKGYKQNYRALVGRAIETWQRETGKLVSFQFVPAPAQANIVIDWTDDTGLLKEDPKEKDSHTVGLCQVEGVDARGNFTKTKVSLLTISPEDKVPYKDLVIESIALHEFGHALGLPHSNNPLDVMFPWERNEGSNRTQLSKADIGRVVQLYTYNRPGAAKTKVTSAANK
jgi:Putative Zn-dependent protease, contains TPR repeats